MPSSLWEPPGLRSGGASDFENYLISEHNRGVNELHFHILLSASYPDGDLTAASDPGIGPTWLRGRRL